MMCPVELRAPASPLQHPLWRGARLALVAVACAVAANASPSDTVRRGTLQPELLLTGELRAIQATEIAMPRTPQWELEIRWLVEDGARVEAGDRVVEFDTSALAADLDQKRLELDSARQVLLQTRSQIQARVLDARIELEQRRTEMEKAQLDMTVPQRLLSQREFQQDRLALERAEVEESKARAELDLASRTGDADIRAQQVKISKLEREVSEIERAIASLLVDAPRPGVVVVAENWREGRKLQAGDRGWVGMPVARIPDLDQMAVEAELADVDDGRVVPGMRVRCIPDAYPELVLEGGVRSVSGVAQEASRSQLRRVFRVLVDLERSDPGRLRPGMSVRVEVLPRPLDDVLLVPRKLLAADGDRWRVRRAGGELQDVELGPCSALECVVTAGLEEGDRLEAPW
jgi:multidrug resistance efflux pump